MDFFTRVLSTSGSNRFREKAKDAEQANQIFKEKLGNLKSRLESEENSDVVDFLDMVYESSFPEDKVFLKTPSRANLSFKKELVLRLLIGLDSLGVPALADIIMFTKKYGPEDIADSLMTLLNCLSPLLEGKEAPEFSTDDVMDAMDEHWHSRSGKGSPLLTMFSSAASSPRASAASLGDSPLHSMYAASPYRRAISDRSMLFSRSPEVSAKSAHDKTFKGASTPPRPSQTMSASLPYPSTDQDFHFRQQTIPENPPATETTQFSINDEKPSSYSLDMVPGLQRIHRRKSSSLKELFADDGKDKSSGESAAGALTKRKSSSTSSWRRNSSELKRLLSSISGTSSPRKSGVAAVDSKEEASVASEKELLSSIQYQDKDMNRSSRKGSRRVSPSPPADEIALWREDSGGFSVDLTSSIVNADQTVDSSPIHYSKPSVEMEHEIEEHAAAVEASTIPEDSIQSSKSINLEQKGILDATLMAGNKLSESVEHKDTLVSDKDGPRDPEDVNSTEKRSEIEAMTEIQMEESRQDTNKHARDYNQPVIDDCLSKDVSGTVLGDSAPAQTNQSNVLRHGHHARSNSDLTPVKNFLKAEISKQEKFTPQRRSESDAQAKMGKLRKFARHIRSLRSSMEGLRSRGGSGEIVVKQEPTVSTGSGQLKEDLVSKEHEAGTLLDAASDKSTSSTSSSSSSESSDEANASHVDERSSALHHLEVEENAGDVDVALKGQEPKLALQSPGDGHVYKDAREAQLLEDHKENAGLAALSSVSSLQLDQGDSLSTHEEFDAGLGLASQKDGDHAHLRDNLEEDAGATQILVQNQGGDEDVRSSLHSSDEEAGHGLTHEEVEVHRHTLDEDAVHAYLHDDDDVDARHELSSGTSDLDAGNSLHIADPDQQDESESSSDKTTSMGTSLVGNAYQWIVAPFLPSNNLSQDDADGQPHDAASPPLKDDKDLNAGGKEDVHSSSHSSDDEASSGHGHTHKEVKVHRQPPDVDVIHAHMHDDDVDAGHAHSSGTHSLEAGSSRIADPDQQAESDSASDKATSMGAGLVGSAYQWIVAPFVPSSNLSQDADDQHHDVASLPLKDDKDLNSGMGLVSQNDGDHAHLRDNLEEDAGLTVPIHVQNSEGEEDVCSSLHTLDDEAGHRLIHEEVEVHRHPPDVDAVHAHTHDDDVDARHAHSLGTHDLDAGNSHLADPDQQDESESASDKTTSVGTSLVGNAFQWIVAPFVTESNFSKDGDGQPRDAASLPLKDDKALENMGSPSVAENGSEPLHAALSLHEDLQITKETEDVESSSPVQGQQQVNAQQHEYHSDEPEWSSVGDKIHSHLPLTHAGHGSFDGSRESPPSESSADASPSAGDVGFPDSIKQSDDQHDLHHVEKECLLQKLPSLDVFNTRNIDLPGSDDGKSTAQATSYRASSLSSEETDREETLWSKDDKASTQEAPEKKDDTLPNELNGSARSLDAGNNFIFDTDSDHTASLNENVKLEKPEFLGEDHGKKENAQPLEGHVGGTSEVDHGVTKNPIVGADQTENSFLQNDAADEGVSSDGRELPLASEAEAGNDDKMIKAIIEQGSLRGQLSTAELQAVVDEILMRENSGVGIFDNTGPAADVSPLTKQVMSDAVTRRRLEEYLRAAAEEERTNAGSSTVDIVGGEDQNLAAGLGDHEIGQQGEKNLHISSVSKKADPAGAEYASLHGHPTSSSSSTNISHVGSPQKTDKHVQATFSDPTMEKYKRSTSKRKGGRLGKWVSSYFQCFSMPETKSHHKTSSL